MNHIFRFLIFVIVPAAVAFAYLSGTGPVAKAARGITQPAPTPAPSPTPAPHSS
jgi:hypothetical protein